MSLLDELVRLQDEGEPLDLAIQGMKDDPAKWATEARNRAEHYRNQTKGYVAQVAADRLDSIAEKLFDESERRHSGGGS